MPDKTPPSDPLASAGAQPETFEAALQRLEQIVGLLEKGELSLDDSLRLYEEGIARARQCQARLDEAEARIEILTQDARRASEGPSPASPLPSAAPATRGERS
jgi:exodeoxyribonuclease VII small subunit